MGMLPYYQFIWVTLRQMAKANNISDDKLALYLQVDIKTLKRYDISAHNLKLYQLCNFIAISDINIKDYFSSLVDKGKNESIQEQKTQKNESDNAKDKPLESHHTPLKINRSIFEESKKMRSIKND